MDLPKSFTIALNAYSALALLSLLKSFNHEPRPFHVSDIKPTKCWLEYGNPSGHSLITSSMYLTFWEMLCRSKGWLKGSLAHRLSLALVVALMLIVAFSRIYHGVHTFNQIINGWIWGVGLYVLYCDILHFELCRFVHSLKQKPWNELIWNFGTKNFFFIYSLAVSMYFIGSYLNPVPQEWLKNIEANCGTIDPD